MTRAQRRPVLANCAEMRSADRDNCKKHAAIVEQIEIAQITAATRDAVNEAIGSEKCDMFRRFAQAHTFEVLLDLANEQLRLLAPRYRLAKAPKSDRALQVIDLDMGNEVRGRPQPLRRRALSRLPRLGTRAFHLGRGKIAGRDAFHRRSTSAGWSAAYPSAAGVGGYLQSAAPPVQSSSRRLRELERSQQRRIAQYG
jgi:hypothetical protein